LQREWIHPLLVWAGCDASSPTDGVASQQGVKRPARLSLLGFYESATRDAPCAPQIRRPSVCRPPPSHQVVRRAPTTHRIAAHPSHRASQPWAASDCCTHRDTSPTETGIRESIPGSSSPFYSYFLHDMHRMPEEKRLISRKVNEAV